MKNRFKTLLLLPFILLTSCEGNKASIYSITDYDLVVNRNKTQLFVELTTENLLNLIESNASFPLYFRSENCSSCLTVSNYTSKYITKAHTVIYSYEFLDNRETYIDLVKKYPDIFPSSAVTPRFLIFKEGALSIEINNNKFQSEKLLHSSLETFLKKSKIFTLSKFENLDSFLSENESCLIFTYNRQNLDSLNLFNEYIFNNVEKANLPILAIDVYNVSSDEMNLFANYFSLTSFFNTYIEISNSKINKSINYEINLDSFIESITTYFE